MKFNSTVKSGKRTRTRIPKGTTQVRNAATEQTITVCKTLKELKKRRREQSLNDLAELSQELGLYK